jgi:hypothetical protein
VAKSEEIDIVELLEIFDPEPEGLLRSISVHITDEMLEEIARADYGLDVDKHFEALVAVRDTGIFPKKMVWFPGEVLELTRYSPPKIHQNEIGAIETEEHWIRAFCCAALLRATREPFNYGDGIATDYSLVKLIFSLQALPTDFNLEAIRFMAWLLKNSDPGGTAEQVCYYGVGLLWFALCLREPRFDSTLVTLAQWIARREDELRRLMPFSFDRWPLGVGGGNPPPSDWELLGPELCQLDLSGHSEELKEWVQLIGSNLAG